MHLVAGIRRGEEDGLGPTAAAERLERDHGTRIECEWTIRPRFGSILWECRA